MSDDESRPALRGLSDIYRFFRENSTPVYFVSPTAYNILGLDDWVSALRYVCYFDSFDGAHDHIFVPSHPGPGSSRPSSRSTPTSSVTRRSSTTSRTVAPATCSSSCSTRRPSGWLSSSD